MATVSTPPPPPRMTGNAETDFASLVTWAFDFYQAVSAQNDALNNVIGFDSGSFDISDLPDPATATVGSAQQTANDAYALAAAADSQAEQNAEDIATIDSGLAGTLTVSDANTTATHTFAVAEDSTAYKVFLQPTGTTGSPVLESTLIIDVSKSTGGFTITVNTAPGAGKTVTFDWHLRRD